MVRGISEVSVEMYNAANRLGAWSYILGQIFLAGPLQILRGLEQLRARIPYSARLENELIAFRDELRTTRRWLLVSDFKDREKHIAYLARLKLVDFSPRKGTFKAR